MKRNHIFFACALAMTASAAAGEPPTNQPGSASTPTAPPAEPDSSAVKPGEPRLLKPGDAAPTFTLTDTDGKSVNLADYLPKTAADGTVTPGKVIVLQWFNPDCPFIKKHHLKNKTMHDLAAKHATDAPGKVVWLAINSAGPGKEGHGLEKNAKAKTDYAIAYPILLDEGGAVGKAYGAKATPHMFMIGTDGKLAYSGAIDNDRGKDVGTVNYVAQAVDELLAGKAVSTPETKPYGCSVKYAD